MGAQEATLVRVTKTIKVVGVVDQPLLDHLATVTEGDYREMHDLGGAVPAGGDAPYENNEFELVGVESSVVTTPNPQLLNNNEGLLLSSSKAAGAGAGKFYSGTFNGCYFTAKIVNFTFHRNLNGGRIAQLTVYNSSCSDDGKKIFNFKRGLDFSHVSDSFVKSLVESLTLKVGAADQLPIEKVHKLCLIY